MARDQTQPGSFSREKKEPGNEVGLEEAVVITVSLPQLEVIVSRLRKDARESTYIIR